MVSLSASVALVFSFSTEAILMPEMCIMKKLLMLHKVQARFLSCVHTTGGLWCWWLWRGHVWE